MTARNQSNVAKPDPFAFDADDGVVDLTDNRGARSAHLAGIDQARCIELLESTPIGRIAFVTDQGPLVLPVNFAWFEQSIVFRTLDSGQKLAAAAHGQTVCFEVDHWSAEERAGWSVVVRGVAREVTQWAEREQLENIGLVPWAREAWRPVWIRVDAAEVTGRILR